MEIVFVFSIITIAFGDTTLGYVVTNVCEQERITGPCRAYFPRYFYNKQTGECEEFIYGGCRGNDNNFSTMDSCERTCNEKSSDTDNSEQQNECQENSRFVTCGTTCPLTCENFRNPPMECNRMCYVGCECLDGYVLSENGSCILSENCPRGFLPDVREGSQNLPFACQQDKKVGSCDQNFSRFFYNRASAQCQEFIYSGCRGNDNNFQSSEDCEAVCQSETSFACQQDKEVGTCHQNYSRFFYNRTSGRCQEFMYSGCLGNDNNFQSSEDCEAVCQIEQISSNLVRK